MLQKDLRLSRRELLAVSATGALASVLAACGTAPQASAPSSGGQAQPTTSPVSPATEAAILGDPPAMDPVFTTATITSNVSSHIFEGLFARGADYAPKLMLAESYDASADGLTHTFKLRKGVQFHNGKEMDSEDVQASMQRWLEIGPIQIQPTDRNIVISETGTISVRECSYANSSSTRGKLRLVGFAQGQRLQKDGSSLFAAPTDLTQCATSIDVAAGHVSSSTSSIAAAVP